MLFSLRSGMFSRDIIPSFIATFKEVVKANFSTEVVRALATFVTSYSQKGNSSPQHAHSSEIKSNGHIHGDKFDDLLIVTEDGRLFELNNTPYERLSNRFQ